MSIERLKNITITDQDIDWVESILGNDIHFDKERRDIIKTLDSVDIQAFPGSGKTTVLVAKLAILAKKWSLGYSGICILSHTNVAREEIEDRLGNTEIGRKLLSYPHFIGTLHSFFDTYVSIPWLHSKGIRINIIDTDLVQKERWNHLPWNFRSGLEKRGLNESVCSYKHTIGNIEAGRIGQDTDTYKAILTSISESQEKGNFTFDEILQYARESLSNIPFLPESLQQRFPMLFIDEAQDTNAVQWQLLHQAFNADGILSVYQGFGDENQAIYNYINEKAGDVEFPRQSPLFITNSKRFGNHIAKLANTVALSHSEMIGYSEEFTTKNCKHTIFLFPKDHINQVMEAYGKLILDTFSDEDIERYHKEGCHIIGMVHDKKDDTPPNHFPKGIYDYWPPYTANVASKSRTPRTLIEYFRNGKNEFDKTGEMAGQIEWIAKGLRRVINTARDENFILATKSPFAALQEKLMTENQKEFREAMHDFALAEINTKKAWTDLVQKIASILPWFDVTDTKNVDSFLVWVDEQALEQKEPSEKERIPINIYRYSDAAGRTVDLEFGSIHSVKGRTHLATLVLETFSKTHNLKSILPYLCAKPHKRRANPQNQARLKCHYVAMTRARGLLCLAIPVDFVDGKAREQLKAVGWNIMYYEI